MSKLCNIIYWLGLQLWLAGVLAAGIAAVFVFARLPDLGVSLERYAAYTPADQPDAHAILAGGYIMEGIFTTADFIAIAAAGMVVVTLCCQLLFFRYQIKRPANIIRSLCIVIATGILIYHVTTPAPDFNRTLRQYWNHAEAGDMTLATADQKRLDALHPQLRMLLQTNACLLFIAIMASAAAMTQEKNRDVPQSTALEDPSLIKRS